MDNQHILLTYAEERNRNAGKQRRTTTFFMPFFEEYFGEFPKTEDELIPLLGQRWKVNLCLLGSFFEEYKSITFNYLKSDNDVGSEPSTSTDDSIFLKEEESETDTQKNKNLIISPLYPASFWKRQVPILNLSANSRNLLSIYSTRTRTWHVIQLLCKIKGIVPVSDYHFDTENPNRKGHSRSYAYNKATEKLVLALVKKYDLKLLKSETVHTIEAEPFDFDPKTYYKVRVSSKLRIDHCTEKNCRAILDHKYGPLITPRLQHAVIMNFGLPKEQKIWFDWNIKKSKTKLITKIGARATSQIVSYKSREKEAALAMSNLYYEPNLDYEGIWREDYLNEIFGRGNWLDYDVHASIYQVTHLLNFGEWMGNGIDPYALMFGQPFSDKHQRTSYKSLCMSLYFDRTTTIINHNRFKTPQTLKKYGEEQIQNVLTEAEAKMREFTGSKFDSEIFLHESMLYLDFVWELRQRGINVVQVYDGFYLPCKSISIDELEELMRQCAMNYLDDFKCWRTSTNAEVIT